MKVLLATTLLAVMAIAAVSAQPEPEMPEDNESEMPEENPEMEPEMEPENPDSEMPDGEMPEDHMMDDMMPGMHGCPLNKLDGQDWKDTGDGYCFRVLSNEKPYGWAESTCSSLGMTNCPAKLLDVDKVPKVVEKIYAKMMMMGAANTLPSGPMVREEEMPADNPSPPTASPPKGGDDMMLKTPMVWMDSEEMEVTFPGMPMSMSKAMPWGKSGGNVVLDLEDKRLMSVWGSYGFICQSCSYDTFQCPAVCQACSCQDAMCQEPEPMMPMWTTWSMWSECEAMGSVCYSTRTRYCMPSGDGCDEGMAFENNMCECPVEEAL